MKSGSHLPRSLDPHWGPILALLLWVKEAKFNLWHKAMGMDFQVLNTYHMLGSALSALGAKQITSILLKLKLGKAK